MVSKLGKYIVETTDDGNLAVSGKAKNIGVFSAPEGAYLEVRGAWHLSQMPTKIVIELTDGSLEYFDMAPFRKIHYKDMKQYKGKHPRMTSAEALPEMLYKYYGLSHRKETMSEILKIRLKPSEKFKLEMLAEDTDLSVSELIRSYIQSLS